MKILKRLILIAFLVGIIFLILLLTSFIPNIYALMGLVASFSLGLSLFGLILLIFASNLSRWTSGALSDSYRWKYKLFSWTEEQVDTDWVFNPTSPRGKKYNEWVFRIIGIIIFYIFFSVFTGKIVIGIATILGQNPQN